MQSYPIPKEFRPDRQKPAGRYPLLEVFQGLTQAWPFRSYPGDPDSNRATAKGTWARVFEGPGYMYVAPREVPEEIRAAGYNMLTSPHDEIVVARQHLAESPLIDVYLDILHEFLHILQRKDGRELWPGPNVPYVDRPTELEAYAFSVAEARRLGVPDSYLRGYLEAFWVSGPDHLRLLKHLGVSLADGPSNSSGRPSHPGDGGTDLRGRPKR